MKPQCCAQRSVKLLALRVGFSAAPLGDSAAAETSVAVVLSDDAAAGGSSSDFCAAGPVVVVRWLGFSCVKPSTTSTERQSTRKLIERRKLRAVTIFFCFCNSGAILKCDQSDPHNRHSHAAWPRRYCRYVLLSASWLLASVSVSSFHSAHSNKEDKVEGRQLNTKRKCALIR